MVVLVDNKPMLVVTRGDHRTDMHKARNKLAGSFCMHQHTHAGRSRAYTAKPAMHAVTREASGPDLYPFNRHRTWAKAACQQWQPCSVQRRHSTACGAMHSMDATAERRTRRPMRTATRQLRLCLQCMACLPHRGITPRLLMLRML